MKCDVCLRRCEPRDSVIVWATAAKGSAPKCPAKHVKVVHKGKCQDKYEEAVFDGFITVDGEVAVPCVTPAERFEGDGDKVARMRQLYNFVSQRDVLRLREIDAQVAAANAEPVSRTALSALLSFLRRVA